MTKRFGQNFLINPGARKRIIDILAPQNHEEVWEIGPGLGAMTHMLVDRVDKLTVFEIDHGFCNVLKQQYEGHPRFSLIAGDFLKTWKDTQVNTGRPDCILGNLPYNVGSIIIGELLKQPQFRYRMTFTLQKEVIKRMAAKPGSKDYSAFSAICQFICDVENHGDINAGSFFPAPKVVSSIVKLTPHNRFPNVNKELFISLVNDMFASRRKTLRNNLIRGNSSAKWGIEAVLSGFEKQRLPPNIRGETMSLDEIVALTNKISDNKSIQRSIIKKG